MNSSEEIFHPIKTVRASEAIYEQIKDRIISGELKPGDRLPSERNMMELFQRSRPTIREALRMLERSGYIRTIPGSNGALVTLPTGRNMIESIGEALQNRRQTVPDGAFAVAFPAEALALETAHASGKIVAVEMDQFRLRLWIGRLHAFKGFVQDGCGVVGFSRASVDGIIRHGVLLAFGAGAPA